MENNPRRQFLTDTLHYLGVVLLACVPGTFFNARKAWSQIQRITTAPQDVSTITTIKTAIAKTTPQNVIQVLNASRLDQEDKLAVLAVQQLSAGEVRQALDKYNEMSKIVNSGTGTKCGNNCGDSCGDSCGDMCGFTCGRTDLASGVFCGDSCSVGPGVIGVIDKFGKLGINLTKINIQRFQYSINEALRLVKY